MPLRRKPIIALVLVVVLAIAGGAYYRYRFERGRSADILTLYGNIDIREADLAFNLTGRIDRMLVDEGDSVRKGQLLATLEARRYEAEVAVAKARIAARRATLDRLLAGSRRAEIRRERAVVDAIKADLRDAESNLRRTRKLALDRFASQQKLDSNRARVDSLTARLQAAQQSLSLTIQGPRKEDIAKARTQQQAILGAFLFIVPAVILSGFATPIANMPPVIQDLTLINPMRYFLVIVRGTFLEGVPAGLVYERLWPMAVIAVATLASADWLFRNRLG